ncbi:hypothetical protein NPIL_347941 [Nephila pilipes]|uniref:Uncharacterized protein n=1 Tax=Nephila pilipes TaxID=299642 RepID=A0A8X6Q120_NEPPI|nr:hypothetical protein NPIL_347941 [Nephila pilipes]
MKRYFVRNGYRCRTGIYYKTIYGEDKTVLLRPVTANSAFLVFEMHTLTHRYTGAKMCSAALVIFRLRSLKEYKKDDRMLAYTHILWDRKEE